MALIFQKPAVELRVAFSIGEQEARALDALAGYGDDAFISAFYEKLGAAYMRDHEAGLRTFLKSIREHVPSMLCRADAARAAFEDK